MWLCSVGLHCDVPTGSSIDFSTEYVVEDGWLLSCQKPSVQPKITIVSSALPANGDYSDYVTAGVRVRVCVCVCACARMCMCACVCAHAQ